MLLLSDNDILIKLGLLGLLPDFINVLELNNEQIYIASSALMNPLMIFIKIIKLR